MPNLKFSKKEYRGSILSFYSKVHGFNYEIVSPILTPVMKEISTFKSISGQKYEDVFLEQNSEMYLFQRGIMIEKNDKSEVYFFIGRKIIRWQSNVEIVDELSIMPFVNVRIISMQHDFLHHHCHIFQNELIHGVKKKLIINSLIFKRKIDF